MTLKGHKNHYNVKFLKGYGHSISVKDSKIILKDCHDPFSEPDKEGAKTNYGLKKVQEITITKIAVWNIATFCLGKNSNFFI